MVKDSHRFGGISLDFDNEEIRSGNIIILKRFINPFEEERNKLYDKAYQQNDQLDI